MLIRMVVGVASCALLVVGCQYSNDVPGTNSASCFNDSVCPPGRKCGSIHVEKMYCSSSNGVIVDYGSITLSGQMTVNSTAPQEANAAFSCLYNDNGIPPGVAIFPYCYDPGAGLGGPQCGGGPQCAADQQCGIAFDVSNNLLFSCVKYDPTLKCDSGCDQATCKNSGNNCCFAAFVRQADGSPQRQDFCAPHP